MDLDLKDVIPCPDCGYEGYEEDFVSGCPRCGAILQEGAGGDDDDEEDVSSSSVSEPAAFSSWAKVGAAVRGARPKQRSPTQSKVLEGELCMEPPAIVTRTPTYSYTQPCGHPRPLAVSLKSSLSGAQE